METEETPTYVVLTGNQIVAHNLRMARLLRGWTQEEAAEKLEPYLGVRWSKASYSAAERSVERADRIRNFTADEILAFALAFRLPVTWFFLPAEPDLAGRIPLIATAHPEEQRGHHAGVLVELTFGTPSGQDEVEERLDQVLRALPQSEQGRYMELMSNVAGLAGIAAIKRTLGDLTTWTHNLRDLADLLDEARGATIKSMEEALDNVVRLYHTDDGQRQPDDDAGSR